MQRVYLFLAALALVGAEHEGAAGGCDSAGGACEESDVERTEEGEAELLRVELLQQQFRAKKDAVGLSSQGQANLNAAARTIEFSLGEEELANASQLIPQRLEAAGVPAAEFAPRFLHIASAAGAELRAPPEAADFPLRLRYEPQAPQPGRGRDEQALRQRAGPELWSRRRRRAEEEQKPQAEKYQTTPEEVDLQTLAANVYDFSLADPPCWLREEYHTLTDANWGGQDNVAVYACQCDTCMTTPTGTGVVSLLATNGTASARAAGNATDNATEATTRKARACTLAISGSNDLMDWTENIDALWNGEFCGKDRYHRGFADEANTVVTKPGFVSLAARMQTCDRLVVTGHSLGGAVASLIAECINCQDCKKPASLQGIDAEAELYTFGAPAVYDGEAPTNGRSSDGAFKGRRFWNYDMRTCIHRWCSSWCCWSLGNQDPVPYVAQKVGYRHPKIESVGLDEHGEVEVWNPDSDAGTLEPRAFQWPSIMEHMNFNYIARLKMHLKSR